MRNCEACGIADAPALDYEKVCDPALCPPTADERPETHHDSCPKMIHEVRRLMRVAKLVHTPAHPEGELEAKLRREGWKAIRDGKTVFRWKMLCRGCIQQIYEREARHKEYLTACKKALGEDDQTYSQLLVAQSL